ncbi:MAG: DNA primase [Eubacterium sp.]|nr:DNA primase [Eubacterium sp.]
MYFGDEIIDEVRRKNDIVDLIGGYVNLKRAGRSYVGLCPFHNEKTPSFNVNQITQMYYCFGCHKGGDIYSFLQEYESMTFVEAVSFLAEKAGVALPEDNTDPREKRRASLRDDILAVNAVAGRYFIAVLSGPGGAEGRRYFAERGLDDDTIRKFGLGFAPSHGGLYKFLKEKGYKDDLLKETGLFVYDGGRPPYDKFWNRVMFPIIDRRRHVVGFGGRVMGDGKPKYLNSPATIAFDKSKTLYGINYIHGKQGDGLILCEGYMDVISLHRAGYTNAVAALGTAFTKEHASIIKRITDKVYICFDSDHAGMDAAMKSIPVLRDEGIRTRVIDLTPCKDPDEFFKSFDREEFDKRIKDASISFFFEIKYIEADYDLNDPESSTMFMNVCAEKIAGFQDEVERTNYINAFAAKYQIKADAIRELVMKKAAAMAHITLRESRSDPGYKKRLDADRSLHDGEAMLLCYLVMHPEEYGRIRKEISADSFADEPYHTAAGILFEQIDSGNTIDPVRIMNSFDEPEMKSKVAEIFNKDSIGDESKERALQQIIQTMVKSSIDRGSASAAAPEDVARLLAEKKRLEQMKKH